MSRCVIAILMALLSMSSQAKSIVVLGDSISAAYGMAVEDGWVALLQKQLPEHQIYNVSISGETSGGGLARLDKALADHKPDVLLLELGANDGLRGLSPALMKTNLMEIIRRSQKIGAKVVILGMKIPPNYGKQYVEMFYNIYPQLATQLQLPFVPFILEDVVLVSDLMQADGLHPNAQAQPRITAKILPYLLPLLAH